MQSVLALPLLVKMSPFNTQIQICLSPSSILTVFSSMSWRLLLLCILLLTYFSQLFLKSLYFLFPFLLVCLQLSHLNLTVLFPTCDSRFDCSGLNGIACHRVLQGDTVCLMNSLSHINLLEYNCVVSPRVPPNSI